MNVVTERLIAKSGLSTEEAKVIRTFYRIKTAGKRTKRWVEGLSNQKYHFLLKSGQEKIRRILAET